MSKHSIMKCCKRTKDSLKLFTAREIHIAASIQTLIKCEGKTLYLAPEFGLLEARLDVIQALGLAFELAVLEALLQPLGHGRIGYNALRNLNVKRDARPSEIRHHSAGIPRRRRLVSVNCRCHA